MTTAENNITNLKDADVRLEGKIDQNAHDITGLKDKDTELSGKIDVNKAAIDQNKADITQNKNDITTINGKLTTAEGNIATNQNAIAELKTKVGTVNNGTYLDSSKTVGENLNKLNDGLVKEVADRKVADTALSGRITANANTIAEVNQQLVNTNNHFNTELRNTNAALQAEGKARAEADAKINTKIGNIDDTRTAYVKDANSISQNLTTLDEKLQYTNDRTGGIKRNTEDTQTTIEDSVKVDKQGNVKDVNELSAKKITTTEDADLKGNVTLGTTAANTVTVNGTADFNEAVNMDKGLTVTNGETNLKKTTVDGDLKVTGTITTDKMVFGDKPTNYTEIDHGKVTSKNLKVNGAGQAISSSSTFDVEKNEVGFGNGITGDHSYHKQTAKGINGSVTDKDGNKTYTKVTATENSFQVQDKDGKNKNHQVNTKDSSVTEIKNGDGKTTKTEQTATDITNTAKDGTIKNEANHIENTATTMKTTVTGQATEDFKGGLNTTVTGTENHTVNGKQINTVTEGQENIISGGQTNTITGGQINNITGDQTTTVTGGNISNKAEKITNEANTELTDKVGTNTRVIDSTSITDTVGTTTNRKIEDGKITDTAGDSTVTTKDGEGTTFAKTTSAAYSTGTGARMNTNIAGNHITTGRVDANELGVSDKDGDNTSDFSVEAGVGKGVKASAGNGTTTGSLDVKADEVSSSVKDASGKGSTFKQRIDKIMMESKDVSIKAEETLTNEAKVITNKASEVINNEAVNINNTATGIITSKASEIKNQADKLISNKVGENTWENMENGKITTSIKDGAKQNLTQSNAAGTTQSTVDVGKSTVTIQNADGLVDVVTDGTNTSVQNQTASQIAADVKDGAGNENASVANATISANTIKSGSKANTVISTADGTSFINSEAAAPVTGASGAGTAVNTTIKGNTITTGKVTMDYAEVMKDLGVHGNANITGKTTTGSLEVTGTSTLKGNVTMESDATVKKNLTVNGITTTKTLKVTENAEIDGNATIAGDVTARSYKVGGNTYIDANGIHANNQKITDVADGSISEGSKDAVNGGQLYGVKRDLEHQVDKVGANAAAMANLRPMEFDPSSKWNIAAAIGNYGSETAAALGAFYRPNDNVMVNLSTAFGTGENMVGGGVSVRLGKGGNKLSREETNALKAQVADLTARMDALLSVLNPNMSKDFPDVPENHWAYEAVSRLAGNDIVQGYPDGEFHGERTMTRYEMAEIIYNALSRGAEAEKELVEEFKPELQAMAASEKATAEKAEG